MSILALSLVRNVFTIILLLIIAGLGTYFYFYVQGRRRRKNIDRAKEIVYLQVSVPRKAKKEEQSPNFREIVASAEQMFSSLHGMLQKGLKPFLEGQEYFGLELAGFNSDKDEEGEEIRFYLIVPRHLITFVSKQVTAVYPAASFDEVENSGIFAENTEQVGLSVYLKKSFYLPVKTYKELDSDPLNEIVNAFSELGKSEGAAIQIILRPIGNSWMTKSHDKSKNLRAGKGLHSNPVGQVVTETLTLLHSDKGQQGATAPPVSQIDEDRARAIDDKTRKLGFETVVRVISSAPDRFRAEAQLQSLSSAFSQFEDPTLNGFGSNYNAKSSDSIVKAYFSRNIDGTRKPFILNTQELASIFHLPDSRINQIPGIKWQGYKTAPAPPEIPKSGLLLGKNVFRSKETDIYIKAPDRTRHMYMIGKSGSGKSNMIHNLVLQDIKDGQGLCLVDPHGDLVERILKHIPKERAKDVIVFDPSDNERPLGLNLLEAGSKGQKEFVTQEAISIFLKIFGDEIFGPRIQHYFRNGALTLMEDQDEGATLIDIPRLFTDPKFLKEKLAKVKEPVVKAFWDQEYATTGSREKEEMIPFFSSKFGPFIGNSTIRNIIGQSKSSFGLRETMDQGKVLLINLSKGKVGELNMQLLGLIVVSKIQIAAMSRVDTPEDERKNFYLYVDEFQNFATDSFASILAEARKYKLNLIVAHQFISQLKDNIRDSVFGNVGSMVSFKVGAEDAEYLAKEFTPTFTEEDLINISNYKAYTKLSINNSNSTPFNLSIPYDPDPGDKKEAEAIKALSRLKYGRDKKFVEAETTTRVTG